MKIIDILNKKANGTLEDGFKFKFQNTVYIFKNKMINDINDENRNIGLVWNLDLHLNDEVEVIEENKEIKEVENISYNFSKTNYTSKELNENFETMTELLNKQSNKINELVRAVNKLNRESE